MSSVCVNWTKSELPAEDIYKGNDNWLKTQFTAVINEIRNKELEISSKVNIKMNFKNELYHKMNNIMSQHTWVLFNQQNYTIKHDELVNEFNEFVQKIKYELEVINEAINSEIFNKIENIQKRISKIKKDDVLIELYKTIVTLNTELNMPTSLNDKYNTINKLDTLLKKYQEQLLILDNERKQQRIQKQNRLIHQMINHSMENLMLKENKISTTTTDKEEFLREQVEYYLIKIKFYDAISYEILIDKYKKSISNDRLKIVYSEVKLEYERTKKLYIWTKVYKKELEQFLKSLTTINSFNAEIVKTINKYLEKRIIHQNEFKKIQKEFQTYLRDSITRDDLSLKLQQNLEKLGYSISEDFNIQEELGKGKVIYLNTDNSMYKIMLKLNKENGFSARFIKIVHSKKDIEHTTSYKKQKDLEHAHKWCEDYKQLCYLMQDNGILVNDKIRLEPEETEISYIFAKKTIKKTEENRQSARKVHE